MHKIRLRFSLPAAIWITLWLIYAENGSAENSICAAVFHELGHLTVLFCLHDLPRSICFGAFGMRIERQERVRLSYIQEFWAAAAGPAVNLILGTALLLCGRQSAAKVHYLLAGFNLLPVRPMDGGQMLYALFCMRRTPEQAAHLCKKIAVGGIVPLTALSLWCFAHGKGNYSLLLSLLYVSSLLLP